MVIDETDHESTYLVAYLLFERHLESLSVMSCQICFVSYNTVYGPNSRKVLFKSEIDLKRNLQSTSWIVGSFLYHSSIR